jgi:hypothetical protein
MLIFPRVGKIIVDLWFKLATILGEINAKVLLSITFFVFLYPMSFIYRITSKNPLQIKKPSGSTFVDRNHTFTKEDLKNIW